MKIATGCTVRDYYFSINHGLNLIYYNYTPPVLINGRLAYPSGNKYVVTGVFNKRLFLKPRFQVKTESGNLQWLEWEEDAWQIVKDDNLFYKSIMELE